MAATGGPAAILRVSTVSAAVTGPLVVAAAALPCCQTKQGKKKTVGKRFGNILKTLCFFVLGATAHGKKKKRSENVFGVCATVAASGGTAAHFLCKRYSRCTTTGGSAASGGTAAHFSCKRHSRCATTGGSAASGGAAAHFSCTRYIRCAATGIASNKLCVRMLSPPRIIIILINMTIIIMITVTPPPPPQNVEKR